MAARTWKLAKGKTWQQKLQEKHPKQGTVVTVPPIWRKRYGNDGMLIPEPLKVDAAVRRIRKGRLITQSELGQILARNAHTGAACPMTIGIFLRIVAEAAEEKRREGRVRVTPYWRVVKDDGKLNEKFPGGAQAQARRLREEGFTILPGKGRQPPRVEGFQDRKR